MSPAHASVPALSRLLFNGTERKSIATGRGGGVAVLDCCGPGQRSPRVRLSLARLELVHKHRPSCRVPEPASRSDRKDKTRLPASLGNSSTELQLRAASVTSQVLPAFPTQTAPSSFFKKGKQSWGVFFKKKISISFIYTGWSAASLFQEQQQRLIRYNCIMLR